MSHQILDLMVVQLRSTKKGLLSGNLRIALFFAILLGYQVGLGLGLRCIKKQIKLQSLIELKRQRQNQVQTLILSCLTSLLHPRGLLVQMSSIQPLVSPQIKPKSLIFLLLEILLIYVLLFPLAQAPSMLYPCLRLQKPLRTTLTL